MYNIITLNLGQSANTSILILGLSSLLFFHTAIQYFAAKEKQKLERKR